MADSKHWAKAQASRLEEVRACELELREMWWKTVKAKRAEKEEKEEAEGWTWGSQKWGKWNWSMGLVVEFTGGIEQPISGSTQGSES